MCVAMNQAPVSPRALKQTVRTEGSIWGPIWHDHRAESHLVGPLIESHNVSIKGQIIGGSRQCETRL